jgi:hypothetical protein
MRVLSGVAAAVLALAAVPGLLAGSAPANAAPEIQRIATGTAGDFKVVVTATKGPTAEKPPTASVSVEGFQRKGDGWQSIGSQPVGNEWFWFVVTDKGGICDFSVADVPEATTTIKVSISPSAECAPAETFHADNGRLVRG